MSFTPGPWKIHVQPYHGATLIVSDSAQLAVATVTDYGAMPVESNARLLAAAPELAEALKPFAAFLGVLEAAVANGRLPRPPDNTCILAVMGEGAGDYLFVRDLRRAATALARAIGDTT